MRKPRVIYILDSYPAITETYIQAEIDALSNEYDFKILARVEAENANTNHHGDFEICDSGRMLDAIKEFKPDVLHTHWLVHIPLVARLAAEASVPFTVRAHSFDGIWGETDGPPQPIARMVPAINSDLCLGLLGFPFMRRNFERAGISSQKIYDSYPCINYERFLDYGPNGHAVMSGGAGRPLKQFEDFAKLAAATPTMEFNLYIVGGMANRVKLNRRVNVIPPVQPAAMLAEYKKHRWLVMTAANKPNARGWPIMIAEAQAAGVGVCMRNIRPDLADYVGEAGFLYDSIEEVKEIISRPFPEDMRQIGFKHAKKSDVLKNKTILSDVWKQALARESRPLRHSVKSHPQVSVILPTFNRAPTLKRAIDSVLGQTFADFELLIVDDGSTDDTQKTLENYLGDDRVRIFSRPREGCARARNFGLAQAHAPYLAFQDSDDEWLPRKLEKLLDLLRVAGPEVGAVYSDMIYVHRDSQSEYFASPDIERGILIDEDRLDYQVAGVGLGSVLIKRECFDRVGNFDEPLPRFIDLDLFIRMSAQFDFLHCKEPLVKYYASDGISANPEAEVVARQYLINKYREHFQRHKHHLLAQHLLLKLAMQKVETRNFSAQVSHLEAEVSNLQAQVATLEGAFGKLRSSRAWRALQLYGRAKRSVFPGLGN